MNLNELHQFLNNLIREGASALAFVLIAFVCGILAYRWLGRREETRLAMELTLRERELKDSQDRLDSANQQLGAIRVERDSFAGQLEQERNLVSRREEVIKRYENWFGRARVTIERLRQQIEEANSHRSLLEQSQSIAASEAESRLEQMEREIVELISGVDRVWERPPLPELRPFRPLAERSCPVIAVLNLKGGVGKTTLTINLASRMAANGGRVLMLDLDHQRTLSTIALSPETRIGLHNSGQTLQHFLAGPDRTGKQLASFAREILHVRNVSMVINTNPSADVADRTSLEQVEERLHAEWLLNRSRNDPRLYLRQALQDDGVAAQYRYVFLDCPPRLSPSCVNALAAADFLLVPIHLDRTSTNSLFYLLRELKRMRGNPIFAHLRVLGVVANHVQGGVIPRTYLPLWNELDVGCRGEFGSPVYRFQSAIRPSADLGKATNVPAGTGYIPPALGDHPVAEDFKKLVDEITTRIRDERQQPASVPA